MSEAATPGTWTTFRRFELIVTGKGEESFLPDLFRSLTALLSCHFRVCRRIGQRDPITSPKKKPKIVGTRKPIPDKDAEEIGFPARRILSDPNTFVLVIDDLEHDRVPIAASVFDRYRQALDAILLPARNEIPCIRAFPCQHAGGVLLRRRECNQRGPWHE